MTIRPFCMTKNGVPVRKANSRARRAARRKALKEDRMSGSLEALRVLLKGYLLLEAAGALRLRCHKVPNY